MFLLNAFAAAALGAGPHPAPEPAGGAFTDVSTAASGRVWEAQHAPARSRTARALALDAGVRRLDWSEFERGPCAEAHLGARWRPAGSVSVSAAFRTRRGSMLAPDDAGARAGVTFSF